MSEWVGGDVKVNVSPHPCAVIYCSMHMMDMISGLICQSGHQPQSIDPTTVSHHTTISVQPPNTTSHLISPTSTTYNIVSVQPQLLYLMISVRPLQLWPTLGKQSDAFTQSHLISPTPTTIFFTGAHLYLFFTATYKNSHRLLKISAHMKCSFIRKLQLKSFSIHHEILNIT